MQQPPLPQPFVDGPFARLLRALSLPIPSRKIIGSPAAAIAIAWVPLMILAAFYGDLWTGSPQTSLISDAAVHTRYLLGIPLLLMAEGICVPTLNRLILQFPDRGLIRPEDQPQYAQIVESTRRLLNSRAAELTILALVIAHAYFATQLAFDVLHADSWRGNRGQPTPAGFWNMLVSYPFYLLVVYGWLWRVFLWARCLYGLSRLPLNLRGDHPDRMGGLGFVQDSLRVLPFLGFALSCVPAGTMAAVVLYGGRSVSHFQPAMAAVIIASTLFLAGPLFFFSKPLASYRATHLDRLGMEASQLQDSVQDDRYHQLVREFNTYGEMKNTLLEPMSLVGLVVAIGLPFVAVLMIEIPVRDLVQGLTRFLF